MSLKLSHLTLAAVSFCAAFSAAPSFAKDSEEIVVTAPYRPGREPSRISHFVSYKDLDLRYGADVEVLRDRISDTASWACDQLGEAGSRECVNDAVRSTNPQLREAVWRARG